MFYPRVYFASDNLQDLLFDESNNIIPEAEEEFLKIRPKITCVLIDSPKVLIYNWLNKTGKMGFLKFEDKEITVVNSEPVTLKEMKENIFYSLRGWCEEMVLSHQHRMMTDLTVEQRISIYSNLGQLLSLKKEIRFDKEKGKDFDFDTYKKEVSKCTEQILELLPVYAFTW